MRRRTRKGSGITPGCAIAASMARSALRRVVMPIAAAAMTEPITWGAGRAVDVELDHEHPGVLEQPVAGEVQAVHVGLEPVAEPDAGHREPVERRAT